MRSVPALFAALTLLAPAWAAALPGTEIFPQEPNPGRVIVLGLDGMDARLTAEWMESGELPNFARLRAKGTFAPLMPANPAQSPVSWATLNSGQNPGKTGIFDFIGVTRVDSVNDRGVYPGFGFTATKRISASDAGLPFAEARSVWLLLGGGVVAGALLWFFPRRRARGIPGAVLGLAVAGGCAWYALGWLGAYPEGNAFTTYLKGNMARDFWEELDDAGIPFRGQGTVVSYPPQELKHGKLLAGLGAPDATGGLNSSQLWTTAETRDRRRTSYKSAPAWSMEDAPSADAASGGNASTVRIFRLLESAPGVWESKMAGPSNECLKQELRGRSEALMTRMQSGSTPEMQREKVELAARLGPGVSQLSTWVPMRVEWKPGAAEARITLDGAVQSIQIGSWSDYYHVVFPWSPRFSTHANVRLWVEVIDGALEIYANPLQIDPDEAWPGSQLSSPEGFASALKSAHGPYETLGWACQTHAVKDAELSDAAFLADIEHILTWRTTLLEDAMKDPEWKTLFHFYGEPDRVCHMLMRHMDPQHPQYDAALASETVNFFGKATRMSDSGKAVYQQMDAVVGRLLDEWMKPDDVLLIVSDHGFDSFRWQVNLNNWLVEEGFAQIANRDRIDQPRSADTVRRLSGGANPLGWLDWEHSQAYSAAIGKIYLNLVGREPYGTVHADEVDAVLDRITERLYAMVDPRTGEKVVTKVYRKTEIYRGDWVEARDVPEGQSAVPAYSGAAELTVDFARGYRAAWACTSGGIALVDVEQDGETLAGSGPVISDNTSPWSGDHCGVDMSVVQGIFFSSRVAKLPAGWEFYDATHLAPTVLALMGVKIPEVYDAPALQLQ